MENGSLGELLHGDSCGLNWQTRFMIALGTAQGLVYLHHNKITMSLTFFILSLPIFKDSVGCSILAYLTTIVQNQIKPQTESRKGLNIDLVDFQRHDSNWKRPP
ncbi:hypothetical protein NE237_014919 [Protea cynaroides]|uniref:Uncharacterized protein n=1 Tax=Protea cynaroides TaxID=273540 RepID=A0A9Q0QQK8_9MAGN|nr:hypothetical protein NE237_014919 [Protea cynaroides]